MDDRTPLDRARDNATGIASMLVTGVWMAALFTDQSWWLGALLFGYIVVVPLTAMLFGDEEDMEEHWDDATGTEPSESDRERDPVDRRAETATGDTRDALETLRDRYARGDLTDEQFERKLDRLLETETVEDAEDYRRRTEAADDRASERTGDRTGDRTADHGDEPERERS